MKGFIEIPIRMFKICVRSPDVISEEHLVRVHQFEGRVSSFYMMKGGQGSFSFELYSCVGPKCPTRGIKNPKHLANVLYPIYIR